MNNSENSSGPVSPGHIVGGGHYSLHVPLGDGGLLWLAQDEQVQQLVAVRFLPVELRQDLSALAVFKRRVEAAQSVTHENLCPILEWYESPGVDTFIATDYVEGKSLLAAYGDQARRGIAWESLVPAAASLAFGLEALHRAGLVHHGVSPENIMLAVDKRVKLLNPVVTGVIHNPMFVPSALRDSQALRCFSPQQLAGAEPKAADDFYALGATLFELLTGTPVFRNAGSLLQDIRSTPAPSLRARLTERQITHPVPDEVVDFINACLRKNAAERPASLRCLLPAVVEPALVSASKTESVREKIIHIPTVPLEVMEHLPIHSERELVRAAHHSRRSRAPLALAAAIVLLLALSGAAWAYLTHQKQEKQQLTATVTEQSRQRELAEAGRREVETKLKSESAARMKSEEAVRLANLAEEKRRTESAAQTRREQDQLAANAAKAAEPFKPTPPPLPAPGTNGFVSMFNGTDLTDWNGEVKYWSVKDGFITAQSGANDPKQRHLLVWEKGPVTDFELHFSYRFRLLRGNKQPNGGVDYRLTGETNLVCYQYDLVNNSRDNGAVCDDKKRARLAGFGDSVLAESSTKNRLLASLGDTNKLNALKPEDWNKCVIIAKGNRLTHYLNGVMVADVTDESRSTRHTSGLIALELYTRNTNNAATFLQFTDLKLRKSSGGNATLASAGR